MRWVYSCPHCHAVLNPDETIVVIGVCGDHQLLVGFHPEPGNYRVSIPVGFCLEPGSRWDFLCPLCRHSLIADIAPDLCCLDMVTGSVRHRVYFSRIAGERATFVISAEGVERHGEHAERHSLEILEFV